MMQPAAVPPQREWVRRDASTYSGNNNSALCPGANGRPDRNLSTLTEAMHNAIPVTMPISWTNRGLRRGRLSWSGRCPARSRYVLIDVERGGQRPDQESQPRLNPLLVHDVGIVTGIALCMASVKVLKLLPGLPFAPGHKALLLFPLYVLASRLTHSRWGGTAAGCIMGVIGFLQGDGRFGVLEILKHVAPGLVIDLAGPLARRLPAWSLGYCFLGLAAAAGRITTELVLVVLLGARAEVYLFPAAVLVPNMLAGFLSGFVTIFVLREFAHSDANVSKDRDAQSETKLDEADEKLLQQLGADPPNISASGYPMQQK